MKRCRAQRFRTPAPSRVFSIGVWFGLLVGCNVVHLRGKQIERQFERAGLERKLVQLDGATVDYYVGGQGETLVLLHGFGTSSKWQWHPQVDALIESYHLVMPNLLWFGRSKDTSGDFSIDRQVDILELLLSRLGKDRVHLAGMSYGGLVAYGFAASNPKKVNKVVLIDSPGPVYTQADYQALLERFGVENVRELFLPTTREDVRRLMTLTYVSPPPSPGFVMEDALEELYSHNQREQFLLLEAALENLSDDSSKRPALRAETLIVWGEQDPVFPLEIGVRLKNHLGDRAVLEVIEDAKHGPTLEHADLCNELLIDFLSSPPAEKNGDGKNGDGGSPEVL